MNVIGISGIDGTVDFKREHWPDLEEREYRISQGHDSVAALIIDGEFIAGVAEERLSRRKHTGEFRFVRSVPVSSRQDWGSRHR